MSMRISITVSNECFAALQKLNTFEHRNSLSNTAAAVLEKMLVELRQEWQATGTVRLKNKRTRRDNAEIDDMPLMPHSAADA